MFVRDKESKKCVIVGDSVLVHACDNILFSTDNLGVCIRKFNTRFDILIIYRSGVIVFFPFLFLVSFRKLSIMTPNILISRHGRSD